MSDLTEQQTREALRLSGLIKPVLAGRPPQVQGAVLADLLSLFLAGHHPDLRNAILDLHVQAVRDLIPASEKEVFASHGGRPQGW